MTSWGNSGYVMADLGLLRNLQLHAAVSFGFRIVIHQTRTVWLSRYFPLRYDGNLSVWLVASINFELLVTQVDSVPQPKFMFLTILCIGGIWLGSYISLNEILIYTKSVNMELTVLIYNDITHLFASWLIVAGCKRLRPICFTCVSHHRNNLMCRR